MQTLEFPAMGSQILIAMDTDDPEVIPGMKSAIGWFSKWEQILSRFKTDSELARINLHTGEFIQVSETMWEVISLACQMKAWTGGLVTPLLLNALEFAGYEQSFEVMPRETYRESLENAINLNNDEDILLDEGSHKIIVPAGKKLDLGGVAKGWAAHQAMLKLQAIAPVLVDAGGDIAISNPKKDGSPWLIGVAKATQETENTNLVEVYAGGIATSGKNRRRWKRNGVWQHHIIDPRTNHPARTDLLNVTVLAQDIMTAEAAAKSALILGSKTAPDWLAARGLNRYLMQVEATSNEENFYQFETNGSILYETR
jgi:thiamine biosynthesis lipoprotein